MIRDQGEAAVLIEGSEEEGFWIVGYALKEGSFEQEELRDAYLTAYQETRRRGEQTGELLSAYLSGELGYLPQEQEETGVVEVFEKYKPVARKVRPVLGTTLEEFRIERNIVGDPLADMPELSPRPPVFVPTSCYTEEAREVIEKAHDDDFLWPEERKLVHHLMMLQNEVFVWNDSQKGKFKEEYFLPVVMPVIAHQPWVLKN